MSIREKCVNQAKEAASKVDFDSGWVRCASAYIDGRRFEEQQIIFLMQHNWQPTMADLFCMKDDGIYYKECSYWDKDLWDEPVTSTITVYKDFVVDPRLYGYASSEDYDD